jgi:hypothetical protein
MLIVMPGLVPGIHVLLKADVDGRDKPAMTEFSACNSGLSDQILLGDDFAEP